MTAVMPNPTRPWHGLETEAQKLVQELIQAEVERAWPIIRVPIKPLYEPPPGSFKIVRRRG